MPCLAVYRYLASLWWYGFNSAPSGIEMWGQSCFECSKSNFGLIEDKTQSRLLFGHFLWENSQRKGKAVRLFWSHCVVCSCWSTLQLYCLLSCMTWKSHLALKYRMNITLTKYNKMFIIFYKNLFLNYLMPYYFDFVWFRLYKHLTSLSLITTEQNSLTPRLVT